MHFKNQWYTNWQCRRSRSCNGNVQLARILRKIREKQQVVCGIITETKTSITGNTYSIGAGEAGSDINKIGKNETEIAVLYH